MPLQNTRWAAQGRRMQRGLGEIQIENSHMFLVNALLILIFVKILDFFVYPFLGKTNTKRALGKLQIFT